MEITMPRRPTAKDPASDAKFLFKGTIQKRDASTLTQIPKDAKTAIVRVDEIFHAPPALAKTLGKQITVKLAEGTRPKIGEQLLFHANSWLFGDSVAVDSLKQEKPAPAKNMLDERASDPARNLAHRELENRVADATMVVEGEVSSIHLPQTEMLSAVSKAVSARPVSEHDPKWREAVISVAAVHKGKTGTKRVVVRFPSSNDVQWHRAPKFHTGDRGVWLLQSSEKPPAAAKAKRAVPSEKAMVATAVPGAPIYTALHPLDFQPANKLDAVASVIRTAVSETNS
jgi:hypothetical protein